MTEASSYLPQTRSTTFLLILNKYIFTFLCYIHYVNILKTKCYRYIFIYIYIYIKKEPNVVPVNCREEGGTVVAVEKKLNEKTPLNMHWLYLACILFVF